MTVLLKIVQELLQLNVLNEVFTQIQIIQRRVQKFFLRFYVFEG